MNFIYRIHAIERMFERDITEQDVENIVSNGEVIKTYWNDKPYVSYLILGFIDTKAIHVLYAIDENDTIIVITVYKPSLEKWDADFKVRKN